MTKKNSATVEKRQITLEELGLEKPTVTTESLQNRFARYTHYFNLTADQLKVMFNAFIKEARRGLEMHKKNLNTWVPEECCMMFLDTCVHGVPDGTEKGVFYGVDFGGTNLRVVRAVLDGNGGVVCTQLKQALAEVGVTAERPKGLMDKNTTAKMMFDYIALKVKELMQQEGDLDKPGEVYQIGFTFSFPTEQKRLNTAIAAKWGKSWETGNATRDPVLGQDVCLLLDAALERNDVPAKVVAALNDTTGTMVSAAYERNKPGNEQSEAERQASYQLSKSSRFGAKKPKCVVGVILGTGVNACYVQPGAKEWNYKGNVINTECSLFDKGLPWNTIDIEVDFASVARGFQKFEKMMSGMYVPEICRRALIKVFQNLAPASAWTHNSLSGHACSIIINDDTANLSKTALVLEELLDWRPEEASVRMVHEIFRAVYRRSAALAAVVIAGISVCTGRLQEALGGLTVGVDGTLFLKNPSYQRDVRLYLETILGREQADLIHFSLADDGSGKGAAILACLASKMKKREARSSDDDI